MAGREVQPYESNVLPSQGLDINPAAGKHGAALQQLGDTLTRVSVNYAEHEQVKEYEDAMNAMRAVSLKAELDTDAAEESYPLGGEGVDGDGGGYAHVDRLQAPAEQLDQIIQNVDSDKVRRKLETNRLSIMEQLSARAAARNAKLAAKEYKEAVISTTTQAAFDARSVVASTGNVEGAEQKARKLLETKVDFLAEKHNYPEAFKAEMLRKGNDAIALGIGEGAIYYAVNSDPSRVAQLRKDINTGKYSGGNNEITDKLNEKLNQSIQVKSLDMDRAFKIQKEQDEIRVYNVTKHITDHMDDPNFSPAEYAQKNLKGEPLIQALKQINELNSNLGKVNTGVVFNDLYARIHLPATDPNHATLKEIQSKKGLMTLKQGRDLDKAYTDALVGKNTPVGTYLNAATKDISTAYNSTAGGQIPDPNGHTKTADFTQRVLARLEAMGDAPDSEKMKMIDSMKVAEKANYLSFMQRMQLQQEKYSTPTATAPAPAATPAAPAQQTITVRDKNGVAYKAPESSRAKYESAPYKAAGWVVE